MIKSEAAPAEHREQERVRTLLAARLSFNDGAVTIACHVKDLSQGGARIVLAGSVPAPNEFDLIIPKHDLTRRCRIAWRNADQIGVAFLNAEEDEAALSPEARIRQLEEENAKLRAVVKRLQAEIALRENRESRLG